MLKVDVLAPQSAYLLGTRARLYHQRRHVPERTLFRFLRDPAFSEHYRRMRRSVVEQAVVRLQADASDAAQVLSDVARDTAAPPASRVAAARVVIDLAFRGLELGDLQERIGALEEYIRQKAEEDALKRGGDEADDEGGEGDDE